MRIGHFRFIDLIMVISAFGVCSVTSRRFFFSSSFAIGIDQNSSMCGSTGSSAHRVDTVAFWAFAMLLLTALPLPFNNFKR